MKKIIVIGCPGSGKSTFSRALHNSTGIPLFHLDRMYWNADQTTVPHALFLERLSDALRGSEWIIDGNYASTMELRMQACDTVIFLDYPADLCLKGIAKRRGRPRSDLPWTETGEDDAFLAFIQNYRLQNRPQVMELLAKYHDKQIFIFTNRQEADAFLMRLQR
ncbi:MAG: adenylate kinase [Ruminococcaceae bacterium]|nr:adenylate kinase [Oscillospiraceae bacterium]